MNCYRDRCKIEKRIAIVTADFFKFLAKSHGKKSVREMEKLVK